MLFVTHNLALIRSIAQEVAVMSEGRIVEYGLVDAVLDDPQADYTQRLLADTPTIRAPGGPPAGTRPSDWRRHMRARTSWLSEAEKALIVDEALRFSSGWACA